MKLGISPAVAGKLSSKVVKIAIFATAAVGGVTLISSSVFASLSATAFNNLYNGAWRHRQPFH
jgi:hypothetical protein